MGAFNLDPLPAGGPGRPRGPHPHLPASSGAENDDTFAVSWGRVMGPARAYLRIKRKEIEPLTAPLLLGSSLRFEPGYRCGASLAPQEAGWPCGLWAAPAAELSLGLCSGEAPGLLTPGSQG